MARSTRFASVLCWTIALLAVSAASRNAHAAVHTPGETGDLLVYNYLTILRVSPEGALSVDLDSRTDPNCGFYFLPTAAGGALAVDSEGAVYHSVTDGSVIRREAHHGSCRSIADSLGSRLAFELHVPEEIITSDSYDLAVEPAGDLLVGTACGIVRVPRDTDPVFPALELVYSTGPSAFYCGESTARTLTVDAAGRIFVVREDPVTEGLTLAEVTSGTAQPIVDLPPPAGGTTAMDMAVGPGGDLFVAVSNYLNHESQILRVSVLGEVSTYLSPSDMQAAGAEAGQIAFDGHGVLYLATQSTVHRFRPGIEPEIWVSQTAAKVVTGLPLAAFGSIVFEPVPALAVAIDIKPGSSNEINPRSRGVIPVAVLGSDTFDVSEIDIATVVFGPNAAPGAHTNPHFEDVNDDGRVDLVVHFPTQETGIACRDDSATLTGRTQDDRAFDGTDSISTVACWWRPHAPTMWDRTFPEPE